MGKIIAVSNQKGGVGKTTTAVNLAACLAYKGKRVLLVDCDPQGNATSGTGIEKSEVSLSVYDCLVDNNNTKKAIIKTRTGGLSVIPSLPALSAAEVELASEDNRESFLKNALCKIQDSYDFIIIDSPPALGMLTINIMTAADSILIPIQCEYFSLEGLSQMMTSIKNIQKSYNKDLEIEGILATMFDSRTNLSKQVLDEVKKHFGDKVFSVQIPRNVRLSEAPSYGQPIIKYDIASKGAEAYFALAREVIKNNKEG
ncbi:MAG: ParA family protein [Clostridia bacterium]|nr:ParA family protein [Clostridia bacterium]